VTDPCALTASHLAARVRARELSREEVLAAHLDRVAAIDGDVGAFIEPVERAGALARARAADGESTERAGLPLDGVPVSLKDHFDVEGMRRTDGVRAFADRRSPGTSVAVQRLIDAGATVVGKANQPDFKVRWNTISDVRGATRNPRDLSLSAGGSSGGDAAAVAAGMAAVGLGTDLGGSIRVPAAFCGVWGLRTTPGQVPDVRLVEPRHPTPAAALFSSIGVLARSVDDLKLVFDAVRGPHPADPLSVAAAVDAVAPTPRRVARLCGQAGATVTPEVEARLDRTCALLADAGYEVVDAAMPAAERLPELWGALAGTEMKRVALPRWRPVMGESGLQHAEELFGLFGLEDGVGPFAAAMAERLAHAAATAEWMERHPIVVSPVAGMATPRLDFDEHLPTAAVRDLFDRMRNALWVNLLGLPAVALPNGIQLVARRFREADAFAAATAVADALEPVTIAALD
jgi:amidase